MTHKVELWNKYVEAKKAARDKNSDSVEGQAEKTAYIDWLEMITAHIADIHTKEQDD